MDFLSAVRRILLLNELSGNSEAAYEFRDARVGNSGLSFGATQLDVSNNAAAPKCLVECGFTASEIADLKRKLRAKELSPKLAAHRDIVDKYDTAQIKECLDQVMLVAKSRHIEFLDAAALCHLADYHNQFYLSTGGKMANALANVGRPVSDLDILAVIKTTAWYKKDRDDIERRYNNIVHVVGGTPI